MKKHETKKGFTLIELLIVIAIIAILAVAFLPTLLGAPAKGRDTARIADLQKIQKVLVNANLEKGKYPAASGAIIATLDSKVYGLATKWSDDFTVAFGGALPKDPTSGKNFYFVSAPTNYSFGLWAEVEVLTNGNANCIIVSPYTIALGAPAAATGNNVPCYAILTQ